VLRGHKGAVSGDRGEGDFDHGVVDLLGDLGDRQTDHPADQEAEADDLNKVKGEASSRCVDAGSDREAQREEDDAGAIVQQAFALDENTQPFRRAELLEHGHDRNGVCGGDERTEDECMSPVEVLDIVQRIGHRCQDHGGEGSGCDDARYGQREDGQPVPPELFEIDVKSGLKEQTGEKNRVEEFLGEVGRFKGMRQAQKQSRHDQGHRVRDLQPPDRNGHRCGNHEEEDKSRFVGHDGPIPCSIFIIRSEVRLRAWVRIRRNHTWVL